MAKGLLNKWLELQNKEKKRGFPGRLEKFPLAYNQQGLYFLYEMFPGNPFYNYLDYYVLKGNAKLDLLIESYQFIVDRHEVFRYSFGIENGMPVQKLEKNGELELFQHKLEKSDDGEQRAREIVISDARKPFDLSKTKNLRLSIVQIAEGHYAVGVVAHHIIIDKWSMSILQNEVSAIYCSLISGESPEKTVEEMSFGEYAKDQIDRKADKDLLNYWLQKLEFDDQILNLPIDYNYPSESNYNGKHFRQQLGRKLSEKVQNLCKELNVTPFIFLFSVFNILLYKYSGRKSINIAVPFSHKDSSKLENVIGFFDETVILRNSIQDVTVHDFIQEVKSQVHTAFQKKQIPLELIVREINPSRNSNKNPLFQVMFIYHKKPDAPDFGTGISVHSTTLDMGVSKFDLSLFIGEEDDELSTVFEYSTDLFKESTIRYLSSHFNHLLQQITSNSNIAISELNLLEKEEFNKITKEWNDTYFRIQENCTIIDLFLKNVNKFPDNIAVADQSSCITYSELDQRSRKVAHSLLTNEIKPGDIVGLNFERNLNMVVAIIGVLRCGATYLPLDTKYPVNRIKFMIDDAAISAVITDNKDFRIDNVKCLSIFEIYKSDPVKISFPKVNPEGIAYIIYTSGSTGNPKGVKITHNNLLNSTLARYHYYDNIPKSFLLFSSFSFDSSIAGIFWTLSTGGKLVISEHRIEQDMNRLGDVFRKEQITHTLLLPGLYREVLHAMPPHNLRTMKCVIVAGEEVDSELPELHFQKTVECRLYNEYGPTEATVWATVEEISADHDHPISIGKPIGNTQVYILDDDLQPLPPGITGEIHIGGENVARGYLNNVNATNLKFIENPRIPDSRKVYKTGDLGRFREDGKIEFLGRVDAQMKVRGFRIELGEIEKVVFRFEGIKECAVVAKEMNNNLKRLICCYSCDVSINRADLKNFISLELPDYMVPSEFIELDKLPRLPNGKIDKLKVLDVEPQVEIQGDDTPNNEIEQLIYNVWKEVLNIEILGIHDNFFEIGGDSISSIRIISKAKNVGLNMHANQIFKYQSISELARVVEFSQKENNRTSEVIIGESLLSPIQMWFFENFKNKPHYWNLACNIRLQKSVPERQILKALGALVSRHSALRQTFENVDGSWISKYVAYHVKDFLVKVKEHDYTNEIKQIQEETRLNQGPLFKLILKQSESTDAYNSIVFMAHHLIIDVVSWSIIIDEFAADLDKLDASEEIQLMPGSTQFKDWVEYINDPERISEYQGELRYWRNQIGSAARNPEVPLREKNVITETISIERSTTAKLVKDALVAYNLKVHELIMCIYTITIGDFMKTDEVIVWTEGHGRRKDLDYSESVGWLTSYYPIRFNLEDALDKTLISLKEILRSIPNEGIGYGFLRYIQKEDRLAFPEKFSFNFNGIREKFSNAVIQDMEFLYEGVRAEESEVSQLIDLNCQIDNDHLVCRFRFDGAEMNNSEINTFTSIFKKKLDSTIEHCIQADAQFTPSDFPDADLSDEDLNAILGQV